jgi:hypothetical protein
MMGAGPAMMAPPAAPMPPAPMGGVPAAAALPGMAQLAQAQSAQMMQIQDEMNKQIMMLIASLPTPNPAGEAAVSAPLTPMMSGADTSNAAPMGDMPMGGGTGAY